MIADLEAIYISNSATRFSASHHVQLHRIGKVHKGLLPIGGDELGVLSFLPFMIEDLKTPPMSNREPVEAREQHSIHINRTVEFEWPIIKGFCLEVEHSEECGKQYYACVVVYGDDVDGVGVGRGDVDLLLQITPRFAKAF